MGPELLVELIVGLILGVLVRLPYGGNENEEGRGD